MRKLIVIAAIILASASAQAAQTRGLTVASADVPAAATDQARPVDASKSSETTRSAEAATPSDVAKPADPPKFVERPAIDTTTTTSQGAAPTTTTQPTKDAAARPSTPQTAKADKPRYRQRTWTESRIIGELHRHGIYW